MNTDMKVKMLLPELRPVVVDLPDMPKIEIPKMPEIRLPKIENPFDRKHAKSQVSAKSPVAASSSVSKFLAEEVLPFM